MSALIPLVFITGAVAAIRLPMLAGCSTGGSGIFDRIPLDLLVQQMVAQVQSFPLIAIPFFMPLTGAIDDGGRLGNAPIACALRHGRSLARRSAQVNRPVVHAVRRGLRLGRGRCLPSAIRWSCPGTASWVILAALRLRRLVSAAYHRHHYSASIPLILYAVFQHLHRRVSMRASCSGCCLAAS